MRSSKRIALCGMLAALAVVILLLGAAIGIGVYAAPVLAMVILLPILEEFGAGTAAAAWIAVSVLGWLLVPDRELCLVYLLLGWYPLARRPLDRLPGRLLPLLLKLMIYAASVALLYGVLLRLLVPDAVLSSSPLYSVMLLVGGAVVFLLSDRVLARMTFLWHKKLRRRLM